MHSSQHEAFPTCRASRVNIITTARGRVMLRSYGFYHYLSYSIISNIRLTISLFALPDSYNY